MQSNEYPCGSVLPYTGIYWAKWLCAVKGGSLLSQVVLQLFRVGMLRPSFQVGLCCLESGSLLSQLILFCPRWVCTVPGGFYRLKWAFPVSGGSVLSPVACTVPGVSTRSKMGLVGLWRFKYVYNVPSGSAVLIMGVYCLKWVCSVSSRSVLSQLDLYLRDKIGIFSTLSMFTDQMLPNYKKLFCLIC